MGMGCKLPRLVVLDLYRNALSTIERMSRKRREKKLHAWAIKAREEVSDQMIQLALDEMYGEVETTEEEKKELVEEAFYK
jgi:hypothetical protein